MRGLSIALAILLCASCLEQKTSTPIRAVTVVSTESGYQWAEVTFNTLRDLKHMNGDLFQFFGAARINALSTAGDVIEHGSNKLYVDPGKRVNLRYEVKDGVAIPLDYDSMAMLSAYYHFEKISEFWRDEMGVSFEDFGKLRIMYNPSIGINDAGTSLSLKIKFNAAFTPTSRDFLLFETSRMEDIPVKLNMAILAHEYGHAIFNYAFDKKDPTFRDNATATADESISGLDEGLADFFAWVITQDPAEMGQTNQHFTKYRSLPVKWTSKALAADADICEGGSFYCKGSVLASALYEIATQPGNSAISVAKAVYAALSTFRDDWTAHKKDSNFDYHYLLARIIDAADSARKSDYCTSFNKWFDDSINEKGLAATCTSN